MAWQNYIVPVAVGGALMTICYLLGRFDFSFLWIIVLVTLSTLKSYMWRKREIRLMALRQTALKEREVIMAQLQDLPAWVQFPDTERVEWINKVILQLWPYIGEFSRKFLQEFIEPQVKAQMPSPFKSFRFIKMDMGDIPCRVGGIKVYTHNVGRDRIIVDMEVAYAGDSDFSVSVAGFVGGLNQLQFSGKLRAILKPLLPYPPMVGGVSAFFLEPPKIDFNLTGLGEMVELPGLMNAIRTVVNTQVANICVLPNEVVVPLAPAVDVTKLFFPEPDGIIRLKIIEARNLENRDISFIKKGKSDPYCEMRVGSQFFKTRTIDNDLNPIWNEYFEAIVDQADGQTLRIELFDEDTTGSDEELGRLSIDLKKIKENSSINQWFPLEGCKHGDIHIKATWLYLSSSPKYIDQYDWEKEWLGADKPIHPAILMVFIDNISDLPFPKAKLEPSPYVKVTLGRNSQSTPVKVKTVNPLYQSKFTFFLRRPEGEELKIEALDDGTQRSLGDLSLPLEMIINEPKMEIIQHTFMLTQGVHQSPIVITARIRAFIMNPNSPTSSTNSVMDDFSYANAVHIERAEKIDDAINRNSKRMHGEQYKSNLQPEVGLVKNVGLLRRKSTESALSNHSLRQPRNLGDKLFSTKHSLSSDMSNGGNYGRLQFSLNYSKSLHKLFVVIHQASELRVVNKARIADPYVSIKLISNDGLQTEKKKTAIAERTSDPRFDNQFEFDIHSSDIKNYKLQLVVKDATNYGIFTKPPVLGGFECRLENIDLTNDLTNHWVNLSASVS